MRSLGNKLTNLLSRPLFLGILLLVVISLQAGDLKKIEKRIEKGEYEKAVELIRESLAENENNPGVKFYYAKLFLLDQYTKNNLDSAKLYIFQARSEFPSASLELLEEMGKIPLNKDSIENTYSLVSDLLFERSIRRNAVKELNEFLNDFPEYERKQEVIDARDKIIFEQVKVTPRIEGFQNFLSEYPQSMYAASAKFKLDSLLVLKHSKSDSREDLEAFIRNNPQSQFVDNALEELIGLRTLSGDPEDFLRFIEDYANYQAAQKALHFLFHLDAEQGYQLFGDYSPFSEKADSLRQEKENDNKFFFPVFDQTIQLISLDGQVISTPFETMNQDFLCSGVIGNTLYGKTKKGDAITSISGKVVENYEMIKDLGAGFILSKVNNKTILMHKSGEVILENIQDADVLNNQFLKVKKGKWGVYSLLGEQLIPHQYEDFSIEGQFWFVKNKGLFSLTSSQEIKNSFGTPFKTGFKFEDYELLDDGTLLVFLGDEEALIENNGKFIIPWGIHQVIPAGENGFVKGRNDYYFINQPSRKFKFIDTSQSLATYATDSLWYLESKEINWKIGSRDTIRLIGNHMAIIQGENPRLIFKTGITKNIDPDDQISLMLGSGDHILIRKKDMSALYDSRGDQLISGNFEKVNLISDSLLAVSFKRNTGLFSAQGDQLLPVEFDQITADKDEMISCLKAGKIGAYDLKNKVSIDTDFESRISRIGEKYQARRKGKFGLIDRNGETVVPYEYDRIMEWTDTLVWVQLENEFQLLNLNDLVPERTVTLLSDFGLKNEIVKKFYGERGFGLIGNESNVILQPNFTDIRLIGDDENQIIVGEQALPQAGYTVITYFDSSGNKIHSQAYRPDEYENVFCDE